LSNFIDGEDVRLLVQGIALGMVTAALILGMAATLGAAWTVFRAIGGL